jgi:hypothetical protein
MGDVDDGLVASGHVRDTREPSLDVNWLKVLRLFIDDEHIRTYGQSL